MGQLQEKWKKGLVFTQGLQAQARNPQENLRKSHDHDIIQRSFLL